MTTPSSSTPAPSVSVIIPHFNDLPALELCLAAVAQQTMRRDRIEVIVADNNSACGLAAVAACVGARARVISVTEPGAGPARNGGVAISRGAVLAFTDCDCVPEPGWLEAGVAALDALDVVGGRVRVLVADAANLSGAEAFERVFAFDFKTYIEKKGFSGAGNLFCRRKTFAEVGGFKAGLSEDVEWSRRATAKGLRLGYAPAAVVGHPARRDWPQLKAKWRRVNRETYRLAGAQRAGKAQLLAHTLLLPASCVAHAPKVLRSPELEGLAARRRALAMLVRLRLWRMWDMLSLFVTRGA